jgi:hypothetical protein
LKSATIIGASFFWYESDVRAVRLYSAERPIHQEKLDKDKKRVLVSKRREILMMQGFTDGRMESSMAARKACDNMFGEDHKPSKRRCESSPGFVR